MNRADRRRGQPAPHLARYRCPDCDSRVTRRPAPSGMLRLAVEHDPTCPAWTRSGSRPYSVVMPIPTDPADLKPKETP